MNGEYDLYLELRQKERELETSLRQLRVTSMARAKAEREYKILLRKECLRLRDEGMAIGMIDKTCYGIPSVADLRFQRDIADGVYKANQEAVNVFKLEIRILEGQIQREWGQK